MNSLRYSVATLTLAALGAMVACTSAVAKSPDITDSLRKSLDDAGLKDVSISQDRDKGVVTLGGQVATADDKTEAESLAKSAAGQQVVADEIVVVTPGLEKESKAVSADLDKGIENNLDAALIKNHLHKSVKFDVKSGVVTLSGEVNSEAKRARAETVATAVPNVTQVVNDLQVKDQKASSSQ